MGKGNCKQKKSLLVTQKKGGGAESRVNGAGPGGVCFGHCRAIDEGRSERVPWQGGVASGGWLSRRAKAETSDWLELIPSGN